jgi:aryl-alcohol dehydrogenase-like predicted oxidoreductase
MSDRAITDESVGTFRIGGDLTVRRLGFGAMRISGARNTEGVRDREMARDVVRRVVDLGVNLIDTANIYGYGESEEIIAEALHPYPADLVITTKAGFKPAKILKGHVTLPPSGHPDHIRDECDRSLQRLRVDVIDLYQVHTPDPSIPYDETIGAFVELQQAGKVRHIGISNVTAEQLAFAQQHCKVTTVQNRFNAGDRNSDAVITACEADGIGFMPWAPVLLPNRRVGAVTEAIARERDATVQQVALRWLLDRSPNMLPIPGTSQAAHADENIDAAWLTLADDDIARIDEARAGNDHGSASTTVG